MIEIPKESGEWTWTFIFRHMAGEWEELSDAERKQNEEALEDRETDHVEGVKLIVRTEEEPRTATTIMLAEEEALRR